MDLKTPVNTVMEPFAIVGLSFKLPQEATNESSFWKILEERKNLSTDWPEDRLNIESTFDNEEVS